MRNNLNTSCKSYRFIRKYRRRKRIMQGYHQQLLLYFYTSPFPRQRKFDKPNVFVSGRPGSKFSPGRDQAGMTFIPAGTGTGTGIEMKPRPGPGLASSRPGPGPGFFQYFSISVKMKQCYMLNKIFQNKLRYVKLKLTVSSRQGRIQGGATGAAAPPPPPREI